MEPAERIPDDGETMKRQSISGWEKTQWKPRKKNGRKAKSRERKEKTQSMCQGFWWGSVMAYEGNKVADMTVSFATNILASTQESWTPPR